jgi:hypothetical protein
VATTGALQQALGSFSGATAYSAVAGVALTAADVGKTIVAGASASAQTWTTPNMSTVPLGAAITICNLSGYGLGLVQQNAADRYMSAFDPSNTATSFSVPNGTEVSLVKYSATTWLVIGSGSVLKKQFPSSLSAAGYKKFFDPNSPSGYFILQWIAATVPHNTSGYRIALPLAFPSAGLFAGGSIMSGISTGIVDRSLGCDVYGNAQVEATVQSSSAGSSGCQFWAFGY